MSAPNGFEAVARERKASRLLSVAIKAGMRASEAEFATDDERKLTAWAARVNPPSAETWLLVIEGLKQYEATKGSAVATEGGR